MSGGCIVLFYDPFDRFYAALLRFVFSQRLEAILAFGGSAEPFFRHSQNNKV